MRPIRIYRPNADISKGSGFQFHAGTKKDGTPVIYCEAVNQTGIKPPAGSTESPFDWKNKIRVMLNVDELSDILASIQGLNRKEIKLVHKSKREDKEVVSGFSLSPPVTEEAKKFGNWAITVGVTPQGGTSQKVQGFISPGQLMQIKSLIELTIRNYIMGNPNGNKSLAGTSTSKTSD